jgi:hypothetical protein
MRTETVEAGAEARLAPVAIPPHLHLVKFLWPLKV